MVVKDTEKFDDSLNERRPRQRLLVLRNILLLVGGLLLVLGNLTRFSFECGRKFNSKTSGSTGVTTPLESAFLGALDENLAGVWSEKYTSVPHLAGQGIELVNWTEAKFKEYGLETSIESFDVLLNYPVEHGLNLLKGSWNGSFIEYSASLKEDVLPEDPTTDGDDLIQAFHGYSASGNVTAQYVYVNYGTKEDFELLKSLKFDLEGKIAIARYGKIFRGLKVKFAQEAGCVGVLLYSDPGDDFFRESKGDKAYPDGPARNPSSLQRGSVQFLSQSPGDPTTPGYPSESGAKREDPYESIPTIPSLPISMREVAPILKKLNGHGFNASALGGEKWVGGLEGFNYWTGPAPSYTLNLYNNQSYDYRPIYNVYGNITGTDPDEGYILIGNHRDAWIKGGAGDPNSGSASMLEVIRGFSELRAQGWAPKKTIVFASWDGEEYGLLGSTEFGEKYAEDLKSNCLAYLNVDVSVSGKHLNIAASPFLNQVLEESLHLVSYPSGESLFKHFFGRKEKFDILGSGSDYTVFQEHLGIPSVDMGFDSAHDDPVYHYHSNYDSYHWMKTIGDPGFKLHNALARYLGIVALKLTERKVIGTKVADYARELDLYFETLQTRVPIGWLTEPIGCSKTIADKIADLSKDLEDLKLNAAEFDTYTQELQTLWDTPQPWWKKIALHYRIKGINYQLRYLERTFLHQKGLDGRPWFKHVVYAAGRDTGYEGFAFPGLKEALDDGDANAFGRWLKIISHKIGRLNRKFARDD